MNILLLMAGAGSRFLNSGYQDPKPLINIMGLPMYRRALDSLGLEGNLIVVSRFDLEISGATAVINSGGVLQGPVMSALLASEYIDNDEELVIINSDQVIEWNPEEIKKARNFDGALLLFEALGDRWSFATISDGLVSQVREKHQISSHALTGVHYWKAGKDFIRYAKEMIIRKDTVAGEYYIAPTYQYAIQDGKKIFPIFVEKMYDLGTPETLRAYLSYIMDA